MTTQTQSEMGAIRHRLALRGEDWLALGMLAVLFGFALAGAFTHMHDWTISAINEALREHAARGEKVPMTPDWFGWSNAVTSEIMPTYALLTVRKRQRQGRSVTGPGWLFVGSSALSLLAQLSATGVRFSYDAQLLVCLPSVALMILGVFKFSDMSYAREAAAKAELAAELERKQAARDAELAAELAAEQQRRDAELAAELARAERAEAAELAQRAADAEHARALELARIEQAAITERDQLASAERAEMRRLEEGRRNRQEAAEREAAAEAARIKAEAEAEAVRVEAAARAEREAAEAALIAAKAEQAAQAAALLARQAADHEARGEVVAGTGEVRTIRQRRPRAETEAIAVATLEALAAGTTRDEAVRAVAVAIGNTERYAREFVPAEWPVASSAGGEVRAA